LCVLSACEAKLDSPTCVGGDGTCDDHNLGAGVGGGPGCFDGCDIQSVSGRTGEYPCEVDVIMDNCRRCHTEPPLENAPFSLETYADSQELHFTHARWYRMKRVVETDVMPQDPPKLTDEEKAILIDGWICECAPPREPGVTCR
jgi:hypothetical protein